MNAKDFHPDYVRVIAEALCDELKDAVTRIEIVGGLRRKEPRVLGASILYIGKIETVFEQQNQGDLFGGFNKARSGKNVYAVETTLPNIDWLEYRKDEKGKPITPIKHPFRFKAVLDIKTGVPVDLYPVLSDAEWGVALTLKTGPAKFVNEMVEHAKLCGINCDGHRLTMANDNSIVPASTEEKFFEICGMPYLEPEQRGKT